MSDPSLRLVVEPSLDGFLQRRVDWDDLAARTRPPCVFLDSRWLAAFAESDRGGLQIHLALVYRGDRAVAAGAFALRDGRIALLADERSDYCDLPIDPDLDDASAAHAIDLILDSVLQRGRSGRSVVLRRLRDQSRAYRLLTGGVTGFHAICVSSVDAPAMSMSVAPEAVRKKSLKRHANGLARQGQVVRETFTRAADILPRLDALFSLHRGRWADTPTPSLFEDSANREFYRNFVQRLDDSGKLRYSSVSLDGAPVAVHLGFSDDGVFTWYKPAFDVALARLSPGEVLLKYVIEQALEEGAREFDFTIGDEGYKSRFATEVRQVHDVFVSRSWLTVKLRRLRSAARQWLESARSRRPAESASDA